MGEYINPRDGSTKEEFLRGHGRPIDDPSRVQAGELAVCLVSNPTFTAAGIAYNDDEVRAWTDPRDDRAKSWWAVKVEDLRPFMSRYALESLGLW